MTFYKIKGNDGSLQTVTAKEADYFVTPVQVIQEVDFRINITKHEGGMSYSASLHEGETGNTLYAKIGYVAKDLGVGVEKLPDSEIRAKILEHVNLDALLLEYF